MSASAEQIGKWLRAARERQGLYSQEQAAHQVGTTVKTIGSWERGKASPPTDTFLALVALYRADVRTLLNGEGKAKTRLDDIPPLPPGTLVPIKTVQLQKKNRRAGGKR